MQEWLSRLEDFLEIGWDIAGYFLTVRSIVYVAIAILIALAFLRIVSGKLLQKLQTKDIIEEKDKRKLRSILRYLVLFITIVSVLKILKLDITFYEFYGQKGLIELHLSLFFYAFIVFKIAQLFDWIVSRILIDKYFDSRESSEQEITKKTYQQPKDPRAKATSTIQYVVYAIAVILIVNSFNLDYDFYTFEDGGHFSISNILQALLIILVARLFVWIITNVILYSYYKTSNVDEGSQFAINQILKYVIYVIAVLFALQNSLHVNLSILLGGAAALMVGIGLGLQQTFNDLISGIILLFERTIEVGDIVEIAGGTIGTVTKIGIRTSSLQVRDNISIIVPNSKFIGENIINWSHNDDKVRFKISIGVAYGSDTQLVKESLLKVAKENTNVLNRPAPTVWFVDFADSSLNFELLFWSKNLWRIEAVKSDLRFQIDEEFRKQNIEIPFPQRVIWQGKENNSSE